jgi:hypothetical protein
MKTKVFRLVMAGLLACGFMVAKKDRDWKTGTLEDLYVAIYTIKADGYRYEVYFDQTTRQFMAHTVPNVTVHGPVRFAMEKGVFYLLDEDGREFRLSLVKKELLDRYTPAVALPNTKTATAAQVRKYAELKRISVEAASKEFREYGYSITPDPPSAAR